MTSRWNLPGRGAQRARRLHSLVPMGLIVAAVAVIFALWGWIQQREERALGRLAPDARVQLYRREIESFTALCGPPAPATHAFELECQQRASFLLKFPECDEACHALVAPHHPEARR